jgi:hypothetical protein
VAHELGGALSPARNALDLVRAGTAGPLPPEQERLLHVASRGLGRAERILQNLLALAAPESHEPRVEAVLPDALLARLCEEFAVEAAGRGIQLLHETEAEAAAFPTDPLCLEQVLANLVSNAIKFTPEGGQVALRAGPARAAVLPGRMALLGGGFGVTPRFLSLEVRDTGVGLSEETRRRLFEPFYRGPEAEQRNAPGMGLGLTVARRLTQLLHGDLRADVSRAPGARLVLTLPADLPTYSLVTRLDEILRELTPRLAAARQTLLVLRDQAGFEALELAPLETALQQDLGEVGCSVLPLSDTTWVVCTQRPVRALVQALAAAMDARGGLAWREGVRLHAQRTQRGASADECLLQSLVRCQVKLPVPRTRGEVLDASRLAGR